MDFYRSVIKVGGFYFAFKDNLRHLIDDQDCSKIGRGRTANFVRMDEAGISYKQYTKKGVIDASHDDIANDINFRLSKKSKQKTMLVIGIFCLISSIGQAIALVTEYLETAAINDDTIVMLCVFAASIIAGIPLIIASQKYKMPFLLYDITPEREKTIQDFYDEISKLEESEKIWMISKRKRNDDTRYTAGADTSISRDYVYFSHIAFINGLKTNVYTPTIGRQIFFFPDSILYHNGGEVQFISFNDIKINLMTSQFRESEHIPSDSEKIGSTWQFVNNDGSPDRRFKDNRKIPVMKYCQIKITDDNDFSVIIMTSNHEIGQTFANVLKSYKIKP
jgi:hypothetical protein